MDLQKFQEEQGEWARRNFGGQQAWEMILGALEELGEVSHAYLKMHQGIRGDAADHIEKLSDGIGDTVVFLVGLCTILGLNFQDIVSQTWAEVKRRDWKKNPSGEGYGTPLQKRNKAGEYGCLSVDCMYCLDVECDPRLPR